MNSVKTFVEAVKTTRHAIAQVVDRFGIEESKASNWLTEQVSRAKFITMTESERGQTRMFSKDGNVFILDEVNDVVITAYPSDARREVEAKELHELVTRSVMREFRRFEKQAEKLVRRNTITVAKIDLEIAELQLKILRARIGDKINEMKQRCETLNVTKEKLELEITEVKRKKKQMARGVALYV